VLELALERLATARREAREVLAAHVDGGERLAERRRLEVLLLADLRLLGHLERLPGEVVGRELVAANDAVERRADLGELDAWDLGAGLEQRDAVVAEEDAVLDGRAHDHVLEAREVERIDHSTAEEM